MLSVNFTLFNANCINGNVNLLWKTSGEVNTKNFSVEKSQDVMSWKEIATVPAAGQSSAEKTYTYKDNESRSNNLYRIVEYDQYGRKTYSSVIKANCNGKETFAAYPNPVTDKTTLNITLQQTTKFNLSLVDSKGSVVQQQENILPAGSTQLTINMSSLAKGNYTLYAVWSNEKRSMQLIKR